MSAIASPQLPAFDFQPQPYQGPSVDEVMALRRRHLTPALMTYHDSPVMLVEGMMQYVFDETGRRYLDGFAGIVTVSCGHSHPAVVTTPEIAAAMTSHIHFNTFGGNPLISRVGRAVLETIDNDGLQANSLAVGNYLFAELESLQQKHSLIGQVRGRGLMLGIELVKDRATKEPATDECVRIWNLAKDKGLLIGKGGLKGNTLRIKPPMCITKDDADFMVEVLDQALAAI